jgi:hypothetical protein
MASVDRAPRAKLALLAVSAVFLFASTLQSTARAQSSFTFVPDPTEPSLPAGSRLVEVADLTGNGVPDLIVENQQADTLGVVLGNGAGGFGPASSITLAGHPDGARVADFNDDGHPDLLVPIETKAEPREPNLLPEHVQILFGDGAGNFTVGAPIALPEPGSVYVGDFTGDGNADVVVAPDCIAGSASEYHMLLGDGHGDLMMGPATTNAARGCYSEVGDFTGNGRDDLVTYSPGHVGETGEIQLLPGESGGGFGPETLTRAEGAGLVAGPADFGGGGQLDLILEGFSEPGSFAVLNGNGAGAFTVSHEYASGQSNLFSSFAVGDFDGDGHQDIATIGRSGIAVLENNGTGSFSPGPLVAASTATEDDGGAFVADVNGDGRPDLILGQLSGVSVLLNEAVAAKPVVKGSASTPRRSPSLLVSLELSHRTHRGMRSLGVTGRLRLEQGLTASGGVCAGHVLIRVTLDGRTLAGKTVRLSSECAFNVTLAINARELRDGRRPAVSVSFGGNSYLLAATVRRRVKR